MPKLTGIATQVCVSASSLRVGGFRRKLADAASAMKANSSRWIHDEIPQCKGFDWQTGYGAFSVSKSMEDRVKAYVHNQEEHHRKRRFSDEFMALLEKHGIPYEERYLWV